MSYAQIAILTVIIGVFTTFGVELLGSPGTRGRSRTTASATVIIVHTQSGAGLINDD